MKTTACILLFLCGSALGAAIGKNKKTDLNYQTSFGYCPKKSTGVMTLKLVKNFEKNRSLRKVKRLIVDERLAQRHFLSEYRIDYEPLKKLLRFHFECPRPLMKAQVYKKNGLNSYEAILVSNGELYDSTYEMILRREQMLKETLPFLAIPLEDSDGELRKEISGLVEGMGQDFAQKLSEVIVGEEGALTIILSLKGVPSSVFMGTDGWAGKMVKLKRVVGHMEKRKKVPSIINLTSSNKVIVKF